MDSSSIISNDTLTLHFIIVNWMITNTVNVKLVTSNYKSLRTLGANICLRDTLSHDAVMQNLLNSLVFLIKLEIIIPCNLFYFNYYFD